MPIDFTGLPIALLFAIFAAAALAVWIAGTRLSRYVDGIAIKTGLGAAFSGMLLLGGITSLPEVAAVSTSAAAGNAPLAVNNLLGTASINLILLAVADAIYGRGALTAVAATPSTLMQGTLSMLLAAAVALIATAGDIAMLGVGAGSFALLLGAGGALWLTSSFEDRHVWEAVGAEQEREEREEAAHSGRAPQGQETVDTTNQRIREWPLNKLVLATTLSALVILVAGFLLSLSADAVAARTGIGSGMIGYVLVGLSTSLPEISSITSAIKMRRYEMAVGDVFGTNLFNLSIIFLADVFYRGEPVLSASGRFEVLGAILTILITGIFVVGLLSRQPRVLFRMGYDSMAAMLVFAGGVFLLSQMSGGQ